MGMCLLLNCIFVLGKDNPGHTIRYKHVLLCFFFLTFRLIFAFWNLFTVIGNIPTNKLNVQLLP